MLSNPLSCECVFVSIFSIDDELLAMLNETGPTDQVPKRTSYQKRKEAAEKTWSENRSHIFAALLAAKNLPGNATCYFCENTACLRLVSVSKTLKHQIINEYLKNIY